MCKIEKGKPEKRRNRKTKKKKKTRTDRTRKRTEKNNIKRKWYEMGVQTLICSAAWREIGICRVKR
jgi:hypothetical protein